jgi:hypothetical protein
MLSTKTFDEARKALYEAKLQAPDTNVYLSIEQAIKWLGLAEDAWLAVTSAEARETWHHRVALHHESLQRDFPL